MIVQTCHRCNSTKLHRNGSSGGRAKYHCLSCNHYGYLQPAAPQRQARYAQVEKLLAERLSQRAIVRTTGVSRMTVAKILKKSLPGGGPLSAAANSGRDGDGPPPGGD